MQRRYRTALALSTGLIPIAACGDDTTSAPSAGEPAIVATTSIWSDVAANLACDGLATIQTVIPIGGDPHSFEPSLPDRHVLETADLIVANGLLLEESLEDTIDAAEEHGTPVFRFADHMTPLDTSDIGEGDIGEGDIGEGGTGDGDGHGEGDPHVWFDPTRVAAALPPLRDALVERAGLDPGRVDECLDDYRAAIVATDTEITALLDTIPTDRRKLVTNHEALGYFAQHYGFEVLGAVIPSPSTLAEANPADLQDLVRLIDEADVPAIFAEAQHSSVEAEALAEVVGGISVVTLFTDSLGPAESGADTYLGLLLTDARMIVDALS